MKTLVITACLFWIAICASACGMTNRDGVVISGTPQGIDAYFGGLNALVTNGKAAPNKDTTAWKSYRHKEEQRTIRETSPGFLSRLFDKGGNEK